jgi:hypothetical protein
MESLDIFIKSCLTLCGRFGVAVGNPIVINFLGHDSNNAGVNRDITCSYEQPDFPVDATQISLWFDPSVRQLYKATNWKEAIPHWELIADWQSVFEESLSGGNVGGTMTTPLLLVRNPIEDKEAVTKIYVDTLIANITTGTGNLEYGNPVATVVELAQVDITLVPDRQIRYVESVNRIFGYDAQSVAVVDNDYVVRPLQNIGRWVSTDRKIVDGGVI